MPSETAGYGVPPRADATAQFRRSQRDHVGQAAATTAGYSVTADPRRPGAQSPASDAAFSDPGYLPLDFTGVPHVPDESGGGAPPVDDYLGQVRPRPRPSGPGYSDRTDPGTGFARRTSAGLRGAGGAQAGGAAGSSYPDDGYLGGEDRNAGWTDPAQEQFDLSSSGQWTRANRDWSDGRAGDGQPPGARTGVSDIPAVPRTGRPSDRNRKPLGKTQQGRRGGRRGRPDARERNDLEEGSLARRSAGSDLAPRPRTDGTIRQRPTRTPDPRPASGSHVLVKAIAKLAGAIAKLPGPVLISGAVALVAVVAVGGYYLFSPSPGPAHVISIPAAFGGYTESPSLATATHEQTLQAAIVSGASGEAKNVTSQVYEKTAVPGGNPQIMGFIGGNLTGGSASNMISDVMNLMRGSFSTDPGTLGGQAACAAGSQGGPAICAWADNDTFGVVFSPTLSPAELAVVMRQLRPLAEHVVK